MEKLLFVLNKSKKAVGIIKRYFFKGDLPDWRKLSDWSASERHLDLMLFLYLHPSQDDSVLGPLRDAYMKFPGVLRDDILVGMLSLRSIGSVISCMGGYSLYEQQEIQRALPHLFDEIECIDEQYSLVEAHTQGNNERLFRLMFPDPLQKTFYLSSESSDVEMPGYSALDVWYWSNWLTLKEPFNRAPDMLFQYDYPLEVWYLQCGRDVRQFARDVRRPAHVEMLLNAFYRICHFDQQAEGDTPRTRFVRKVISMFDEQEFAPGFKALWLHVKAGEVEVQDIWSDECKIVHSAQLDAFSANPVWDV